MSLEQLDYTLDPSIRILSSNKSNYENPKFSVGLTDNSNERVYKPDFQMASENVIIKENNREVHSDSISFKEKIKDSKMFTKPFKLKFSKEIEDNFLKNQNYRKCIIKIEENLLKFVEVNDINLLSKMYFEEDWEVPNFKKIILLLDFNDISFNNELEFWGIIGDNIRRSFDKLIERSKSSEKHKISKIKERFFIKLDLN